MGEDMDCSATAIGPHALLTATHCEMASDDVDVDGISRAEVVKTFRDKHDHSIYLLKGVEFKTIASFSKEPLVLRSSVFTWGNPQMYMHQLRTGAFVGEQSAGGKIVQLFSLSTEQGDSGSAIFNSDGAIAGVVSIRTDVAPSSGAKTGAFTLNFSAEQLEKARKF